MVWTEPLLRIGRTHSTLLENNLFRALEILFSHHLTKASILDLVYKNRSMLNRSLQARPRPPHSSPDR